MWIESSRGVIGVLVGVIAGGIITTGATIFIDSIKSKREASTLAHAFRGEIKAIHDIARKRHYIASLHALIDHMRRTQQPLTFNIRVHREYFGVFKGNINKIGALENPLPERIAGFYVTVNSILEDIDMIEDGGASWTSASDAILFYTELVSLFEEVNKSAEEIITIIDEIYA